MALKKIKTGVVKVDEALEDVYNHVDGLLKHPFFRGNEIKVVFTSGAGLTKRVVHELGRRYTGWIVTDIDTLATVKREPQTERPEVAFTLTASAATSVTLWVY